MILFLPGLICDRSIYAPQIAAFSGVRVVDGYGLADTLPEMARIALEQAPEGRFDLFGHSMGGRVALEVFRLAPERIRRIALVSTGAHPLQPGESEKREALKSVGYNHGFEKLVDQWLAPMVAEANRSTDAYREMREMCIAAGQDVFDAQIHALVNRPEQESLLSEISCPALVMTGELDSWASPAQHEAMASRIEDAELVVVPGAGHMIMREAPEAVNDAISGWLERPAA
jgi:pimeloyl-ACP methyl ester carboxylesterase